MRQRPGSSLARLTVASLPLLLCAAPVLARTDNAQPIRIEAGTLASAAARIARDTGVEVVTLEAGVALVPADAQTLPADPARALRRLLAGTEFRAVRIGRAGFRIERRPRSRASALAKAPPVDPDAAPTITVLAARFPTSLQDYPGTLVRMPAEAGAALPDLTRPADLSRRSPVVFATAYGDGRDKLFVRGIADSSFNGASQPTTAIYFDDARIGFGSPNPNPRLYDVASVEVLEGPQGTLFGAGSIGGVIRIMPNPVELDRQSVTATAQASLPTGGSPGWKLGAAVNLPVVEGKAGLRIVGYDERSGGFIDDPVRGRDINQVDVAGVRAALTYQPDASLKVDLSGLYQHTRSGDAQYVDMAAPLSRLPALPQPFGSELVLGRAALRKRWDNGVELAGVVSYGHRSSSDRFDATLDAMAMGATAYDLQRTSSAWTGEARLSRNAGRGLSWMVGLGLEQITDGQSRQFGNRVGPITLDEVTNITRSASLFAQGRLPLTDRLQATVGLRFTIARTDSEPSRGRIVSYIRGDTNRHADPTVALLYQLDERLSVFARFQTGYRNGGITVARGIGKVSDFQPDSIAMGELGMRRRRRDGYGLELAGTLSYANWRNVLAELVSRRGTPITSNIGDARLVALEASAAWKDRAGWSLGASLLHTANRLTGELAQQTPVRNRHLPDTPALSGQIDAEYRWDSLRGSMRAVSASLHYVGRSVLGPGPELDLSQGNYAVVDLGLSTRKGPVGFKLGIENLLNTRANRFALGNPLMLYQRQGFAPVTPRTFSATVSFAR